MITINFLHHITRLPVRERAVQLIFTDTAFGWMRLNRTDDNGVTTADTFPGPARVYVDGEFYQECWLEGKMEFLLGNGGSVELETDVDLMEGPTPEIGKHTEGTEDKKIEEENQLAGQLTAVPHDETDSLDFLIA